MPSTYKRRGRKTNKTGRNTENQYWNFPYFLAQSSAFRLLSGPAVKVLIELRCRFNGFNNGKISLSLDEAAVLLGMSKSTGKRALEELKEVGFVRLAKQGVFLGRRASEWRITFESMAGEHATHDWKQWQAPSRRPAPQKIKPRYPNGIPACFDGDEPVPMGE